MTTTFEWPVRVYWEDTDAGGIVFYANYLKFFERARTEWLRALGHDQHRLREHTGGMFVVTHAQLRYAAPARLDDELLITAAVHESGRASVSFKQQALRKVAGAASHELLCEGSVRVGWVDGATMRPARIPDSLLQQLTHP